MDYSATKTAIPRLFATAAPQPAIVLPREIIHDSLTLSTKPGASIHYSFARGQDDKYLVVFLNGLMSTKSAWLPVMSGIIRRRAVFPGFHSMLAYDRYGSGLSEDSDPQDRGREKGYGHDVADAVRDLHEIIAHVASEHLAAIQSQFQLILVGNSIGCAIARLYAQTYPDVVAGLLLLDSIVANSDFDWWPDPDAEGFDMHELPDHVTVDVLKEQRAKYAAIFRPDVINQEGLDRRNLAQLLPDSDGPMLQGPNRGPFVTVVGHDSNTFAQEGFEVSTTFLPSDWGNGFS